MTVAPAISRPLSFRLPAALLFAAGLTLFASPSLAQTSECPTITGTQEYVCNLDETAGTTQVGATADPTSSMPFHTGDAANGYVLDSVRVGIWSTSSATFVLELRADDGSGNPVDDSLAVLTASQPTGSVDWIDLDASGITLSADTDYHVVISTVGGGRWDLEATTSEMEDGSTGWTIGNRRFRNAAGNWGDAGGNFHFAILATPAAAAATYPPNRITATAGDGQVTVGWTAPQVGRTPAGYDFCVYTPTNAGDAFADSNCGAAQITEATQGQIDAGEAVISSLTNGSAYWIAIRTAHDGGDSTWRAASETVTPEGTDEPPVVTFASVQGNSLTEGNTTDFDITVATNKAFAAEQVITVQVSGVDIDIPTEANRSQTVTFAAMTDMDTKTVTFALTDDEINYGDRTATVTLLPADDSLFTRNADLSVTITDDDALSGCPNAASGQSTVCNIGETRGTGRIVGATNGDIQAVSFTTGAHLGGYAVDLVRVDLQEVLGDPTPSLANFRVSIHETESSRPGTQLGTLNPANDGPNIPGLREFVADGAIHLEPNTTYHLATNKVSGSGRYRIGANSDSSATGSTGWTVGSRQFMNAAQGTWGVDLGGPLRFGLVATERAIVPRLIVSETAVDVTQGSTAEYTVALSAEPSAEVTVTNTASDPANGITTSAGATLTFTIGASGNWNTPQTIMLTAASSATAGNTRTFTHTAAGGDVDTTAANVVATVRALETQPPTGVTATAGVGQITIAWTAPTAERVPSGYQVCQYEAASAGADFVAASCAANASAISPAEVSGVPFRETTFTASAIGVPHWVAVRGTHDDGNSDWVTPDAVVTPTGPTLTLASLSGTTLTEGTNTSLEITVATDMAFATAQTITVQVSGASAYTPTAADSVREVTFTAPSDTTTKTVTFTLADDMINNGDVTATVALLPDTSHIFARANELTLTLQDNDALSGCPTAGADQSSLCNIDQTARSGFQLLGQRGGDRQAASFSTGTHAGGYAVETVRIDIVELEGTPDLANFSVSIHETTEAGTAGTQVGMNLNLENAGPNVPGLREFVANGAIHLDPSTTYHLVLSHLTGPGRYRLGHNDDATATTNDGWAILGRQFYTAGTSNTWTNATAPFPLRMGIVASRRAIVPKLAISETAVDVTQGSTAEYTVALDFMPSETVTVAVAGGATVNGITTTTTSLTFTGGASGTWATPQTITLTAADTATAGNTRTFTHTASGGDVSTTPVDVVATVQSALPELTITATNSPLEEADSAMLTFSVSTDMAFGAEQAVTVTLSSTPAGDIDAYIPTATNRVQTATFAMGSSAAQTVSFPITNNAMDDGGASVTATITANAAFTIAGTASAMITDDDVISPTVCAAPASPAVHVCNLDLSTVSTNGWITSGTRKIATSFTTGGNAGGYNLNSVLLRLGNPNSNPGTSQFDIHEDNGSDRPMATALATLATGVALLPQGGGIFAEAGATPPRLRANTKYWLVTWRPDGGGSYHYRRAGQHTQDTNDGWEIGNQSYNTNDAGVYEDTGSNRPLMFQLTATPREAPPTLTLAAVAESVTEADGASVDFTVTPDKAFTEETEVEVTLSGADSYVAAGARVQTVTFAVGDGMSAPQTVSFAITNDGDYNGDATATATITANTLAYIVAGTASAMILDDEAGARAPTDVVGEPRNANVFVSWTAPVGTTPSGYEVCVISGSAAFSAGNCDATGDNPTITTVAASETDATVAAANDNQHTAAVRATYAGATGNSDWVVITPTHVTPTAVPIVTMELVNGQMVFDEEDDSHVRINLVASYPFAVATDVNVEPEFRTARDFLENRDRAQNVNFAVGERVKEFSDVLIDDNRDDAWGQTDGVPTRENNIVIDLNPRAGYTVGTARIGVTVTEDEQAEVEVSATTLAVNEGSDATYTMMLATNPGSDVTITATSGDTAALVFVDSDGDVVMDSASPPSPATSFALTFTHGDSGNWDTPRTITVRGVDNAMADATPRTATLTHNSADDPYSLMVVGTYPEVAVTVNDAPAPPLQLSTTALEVPQGNTAVYTLELSSEPATGVTVAVSGGTPANGITFSPSTLTFTTSNWDAFARIVTLTAADSATLADTRTITHTASGGLTASADLEASVVAFRGNNNPMDSELYRIAVYAGADNSGAQLLEVIDGTTQNITTEAPVEGTTQVTVEIQTYSALTGSAMWGVGSTPNTAFTLASGVGSFTAPLTASAATTVTVLWNDGLDQGTGLRRITIPAPVALPELTITATNSPLTEADDAMLTFSVDPDMAFSAQQEVTVTLASDPAGDLANYIPTAGDRVQTVTFGTTGHAAQSVNFPVTNNAMDHGGASVTATITADATAFTVASGGTASAAITDDDIITATACNAPAAPAVYVCNLRRNTTDEITIGVGSGSATSFTTGTNVGGYDLNSATLRLRGARVLAGTTADLRFEIQTDGTGDNPSGVVVGTLPDAALPPTAGSGIRAEAGANPIRLLPSTKYWLVVYPVSGTGAYFSYATSVLAQDSNDGWDIGNVRRNRNMDGTFGNTFGARAMMFQVIATPREAPPTLTLAAVAESVTEADNAAVEFSVTPDKAFTETVSVEVTLSGADDYVAESARTQTLSFASSDGTTAKTVSFAISNDGAYNGDAVATATITESALDYTVAGTASAMILDDELGPRPPSDVIGQGRNNVVYVGWTAPANTTPTGYEVCVLAGSAAFSAGNCESTGDNPTITAILATESSATVAASNGNQYTAAVRANYAAPTGNSDWVVITPTHVTPVAVPVVTMELVNGQDTFDEEDDDFIRLNVVASYPFEAETTVRVKPQFQTARDFLARMGNAGGDRVENIVFAVGERVKEFSRGLADDQRDDAHGHTNGVPTQSAGIVIDLQEGDGYTRGNTRITLTVTEDEQASVVLNTDALTVHEGRDTTYTMRLTSNPGGRIDLTATSSDTSVLVFVDSDGDVIMDATDPTVAASSTSRNFGGSDFGTPQTFTVRGVNNAMEDATPRTATLTHSSAAASYTLNVVGTYPEIEVTVTDPPQLAIAATKAEYREDVAGDDPTFTITANEDAPAGGITAEVVLSRTAGDVSQGAGPATAFFDAASLTQTATIAEGERVGVVSFPVVADDFDDVEGGNSLGFTATIQAGTGYSTDPDATSAGVRVREDENTRITWSNTAPEVLLKAAGMAAVPSVVNVRLESAPGTQATPDRTLRYTVSSINTNFAVSPSEHTFTRDNWRDGFDVFITTTDDAMANDTSRIGIVLQNGGGGGTEYRSDTDLREVTATAVTVLSGITEPLPRDLRVTSQDGALALTWDAPDGATPSSYESCVFESTQSTLAQNAFTAARCATASGGTGTGAVSHTALTATRSGLTNATNYAVGLRARYDSGDSDWVIRTRQAPAVPPTRAPSAVTLTPGIDSLSVDWTQPSEATLPSGYDVCIIPFSGSGETAPAAVFTDTACAAATGGMGAGLVAAGNVATHTRSGLDTATRYAAAVRGTHATNGNSAWIVANTLQTPVSMAIASAPSDLRVTEGNAQATITWTIPTAAEIPTGYDVCVIESADTPLASAFTAARCAAATSDQGVGTVEVGAVATHTRIGLTNGLGYGIAVRGTHTAGDSQWVVFGDVARPVAPPAASPPATVSASAGTGTITVTWTAPTGVPQVPSGYDVCILTGAAVFNDTNCTATTDGTGRSSHGMSDTTTTRSGLENVAHRAAVRGTHLNGNSAWVEVPGSYTPEEVIVPVLTIAATNSPLTEAASVALTFSITTDEMFDTAQAVTVTLTSDPAEDLADYIPTMSDRVRTATIAARSTTAVTVSFPVTNTAGNQGGARVIATITPDAAFVVGGTASADIADADAMSGPPTDVVAAPRAGSVLLNWTAPSGTMPSGYQVCVYAPGGNAAFDAAQCTASNITTIAAGTTTATVAATNGNRHVAAVRATYLGNPNPMWVTSTPADITPTATPVVHLELVGGVTEYTEEGGPLQVNVIASYPFAADTTVLLRYAGGVATNVLVGSGRDRSLAFSAGEQMKMFSNAFDDDNVDDIWAVQREDFHLDLRDGTGYTRGTPNRVSVFVTEAEQAAVVVSPETLAVSEGSDVTYTMHLATNPASSVTITATSSSADDLVFVGSDGMVVMDGASPPAPATDFALTFTESTFSTPQTITVRGVDDGMDSAMPRMATLTHLGNTPGRYDTNFLGGVYPEIAVTVRETTMLTLAATQEVFTEGTDGHATFTVTPDAAFTATQSVIVTLASDPAADLDDYVVAGNRAQTLSFAPGDGTNAKTVSFAIANNAGNAGGARVTATITPDAGFAVVGTASAFIVDSEVETAPPTDVAAAPRNGGVHVSWTAPSGTTPTGYQVCVYAPTGNATFAASECVVGAGGPVEEVAAGTTSTTVSRANGTRYVAGVRATYAGNPNPVWVASTPAAGVTPTTTPVLHLELVDGQDTFDEEDDSHIRLNVVASYPFEAAATAQITSLSTRISGEFLTSQSPWDVAFAIGDQVKEFSVALDDDNRDDAHGHTGGVPTQANELGLRLDARNGYTVGSPSTITLTLTEDEQAEVTPSATTLAVPEGADATYTLVLETQPVNGDATITATSGDPAALVFVAGSSTANTGALVFTPDNWDTPQTLTVRGVDDGVDNDPARTLTITHSGGGANYGAAVVGTYPSIAVTVTEAPLLTLAATNSPLTEAAGAALTFSITPEALATAQTVTVTVASDPAGDLDAYIPAGSRAQTATIAAMSTTAVNVSFPVTNTAGNDGSASVTATITPATDGAFVAAGTASAEILDSTLPILTLAASKTTFIEGTDTDATFTITPDSEFAAAQTVTVTLASDPVADLANYIPTAADRTQSVTIPADSTAAVNVNFPITDGSSADGGASITATITANAAAFTVAGTATARIADDETPVLTLAAVGAPFTEGTDDDATFTVTPSLAFAAEVTVTLSGADAFVASGARSQTLTFTTGGGTTAQTVSFAITDDSTAEADAEATASITVPSDALFDSAGDVTADILDDDTTTTAPGSVTATAGPERVAVAWTAPTAPRVPTGYDICFYAPAAAGDAFDDSQCTGAAVVTATSAQVTAGAYQHDTSADDETARWYAVRGTHARGNSAWAAASATVMPISFVTAPSGVTAEVDNASVRVTWSVAATPASNELAPTSFNICAVAEGTDFPTSTDQCVGGGANAEASDRTADLTGLVNGTAYDIAVRSFNDVGNFDSEWIEASGNPHTPRTVPDAPTGLSATGTDRTITASWTAPADDGGAILSGYQVCAHLGDTFNEASCTGSALETVAATETTTTFTGLTNDSIYSLAVRAVNAAGEGEYSTSIAATPRDITGFQPASVTVTASTADSPITIQVDWTAPAAAADMMPSGYQVCIHEGETFNAGDVCDGATPTEAAAVSTTVTNIAAATRTHTRNSGLTNGETYAIGVRATYPSGTDPSAWTQPSPASVVPGDGMPDEPTIAAVSADGTTATTRSAAFTVAGINYEVPISVTGGMIQIGTAAATTSGMVNAGASVVVIVTTPTDCGGTATSTVTIGAGNNAVSEDFMVTRVCSDDAELTALSLSDTITPSDPPTDDDSLDPNFDKDEHTYNTQIANRFESTTVTATRSDMTARTTINGIAVDGDADTDARLDNEGDNTITIVVTAEDGVARETYTVIVHRTAPPSDVEATMQAGGINVTWTDPSGANADYIGFDVCVHEGAMFDEAQCTGAAVVREAATATSHTRSGLTAGSNYFAAVRSIGVNEADVTGWSQPGSDTVGAHVAESSAPEIVRAFTGIANAAITSRIAQVGAGVGSIGGVGASLNLTDADFERTASSILISQGAVLQEGGDLGAGMKRLLNGQVMAFGNGGGRLASPSFWVSGDYLDIGNDHRGTKWDGDVLSLQLGADARTAGGALLGAAISRSRSDIDYDVSEEGLDGSGSQQMTLTSVHPYLGWRSGAADLWASLAYGSGELDRKPENDTASSDDVSLIGGAFGAALPIGGDGTNARIRAEFETARMTIEEADEDDADIEADAHRARVGAQWSRTARNGAASTRRAVELGARYDGGDGVSGVGAEIGFHLAHNTGGGTTITARARALASHSQDYDEWGAGVIVHHAAGADGQGFALRMEPSWGALQSRAQQLMNDGAAALPSDQDFTPSAQLSGEIHYGLAYGDGMMTPYGGWTLREDARDLRFGAKYQMRRHPLLMNMEAYRNERADTDMGIRLQAEFTW